MDEDEDKNYGLMSGIPEFIAKLYKMLMETDGQAVSWSDNGSSFVIIDISEFTKNLLPCHFKHGNFASFVRQLNKYDFHKVKTDDSKKYGSQAWEFSHYKFIKGQPQLLSQIKRKATTKIEKKVTLPSAESSNCTTNSTEVSVLKSQVKYLENVQTEMSSHLKSLTLQYQQIFEQMSDFRHTISTQEQVIRSLIEYIPNDKKQCIFLQLIIVLNQSLSNSLNSRIFSQGSPNAGTSVQNLDSIINSRLNQFEFGVPEPKNKFKVSFQGAADPMYSVDKPLDLTSLSQNSVVSVLGPSPAPPLNETTAPKWSAPPKVLLVEDDDTCRRLSSKLLQVFGCNFDIAVDGLDAVNRMNVGYKYDLVLMDIMMPNLDGVSATTRIRQFDQFTPIISMTSNITENDCMTYLANGMNDILVKPFNKSALLGIIKRHYSCSNDTPSSSSFTDLNQKISEVSGEKVETLNHIDSQILGLMQMQSAAPPYLSSDESFPGSGKRLKLSHDVEIENTGH